MYKRYDGNTGRFVQMPEPEPRRRAEVPALRNPPPVTYSRPEPPQPPPRRAAKRGPPPARGGGLEDLLPSELTGLFGKLVPNVFKEGFELEDLLLMLILYLMYRESGDKELLIVLGAMLFL